MKNLELQVEIMPPTASDPPPRQAPPLVSSRIPLCYIVNHLSQGAADV